MPQIAELNGSPLPVTFSYAPYVVEKRMSVTPTANAVVTQVASPTQLVHGGDLLEWSIEACYPSEFQALYDLHQTGTATVYTFEGYWGEVLEVLFVKLAKPKIRGRLISASGAFQVLAVTTDQAMTCAPD